MRTFLLCTALLLVVAYGLLAGHWTNRWQSSAELERATARLRAIPSVIGDWHGEDQQMDPKAEQIAGIDGYVMRHYQHKDPREAVTLLIVCGRPGPVALHPPTVCFETQGYVAVRPQELEPAEAPAPG
jgi:hypothetical protein